MHDITQQIFSKPLKEFTREEGVILRVLFHTIADLEIFIDEFDSLGVTYQNIFDNDIRLGEIKRLVYLIVTLDRNVIMPSYKFMLQFYPEGDYVRIAKITRRVHQIEAIYAYLNKQ